VSPGVRMGQRGPWEGASKGPEPPLHQQPNNNTWSGGNEKFNLVNKRRQRKCDLIYIRPYVRASASVRVYALRKIHQNTQLLFT